MIAVVRPARSVDREALYEMAKRAGPGFTNLPPDRDVIADKLAQSDAAFARADDDPADDLYLFVMEAGPGGPLIGTAQIFARIGESWPFYSYRIATLTQTSRELGRTMHADMLTLTTDYEGATEVGGLFVHPRARAEGHGLLLARSRYLFIRLHRRRFADRVIAELRGMIDEAGASPFWDALAGRFFGMSFAEADAFNATHGNQFIADLMPKHPIYLAMLDDKARQAIGQPHPNGRAAMRMLEQEGFRYEGYVDIFDGGPTMVAQTDAIRSVTEAREAIVTELSGDSDAAAIIAHGRLAGFRACCGRVRPRDRGVAIDPSSAEALGLSLGDSVLHVAR